MVHIGGTRTDNDTDLKPRIADREAILRHAYHTMPALKVCLSGSGKAVVDISVGSGAL